MLTSEPQHISKSYFPREREKTTTATKMSSRPPNRPNPSNRQISRLSISLCAGAGQTTRRQSAKVRLDPCRAAHLRYRVATGTDFADAPPVISPALENVKDFVITALNDGELDPIEVSKIYETVAKETEHLVKQLEEVETQEEGGYLEFMSPGDLKLKERLALERSLKIGAAARRKVLLKGIRILTGLTMAGGLIYSLINTADQAEPLTPDKYWESKFKEFAMNAMMYKMG